MNDKRSLETVLRLGDSSSMNFQSKKKSQFFFIISMCSSQFRILMSRRNRVLFFPKLLKMLLSKYLRYPEVYAIETPIPQYAQSFSMKTGILRSAT